VGFEIPAYASINFCSRRTIWQKELVHAADIPPPEAAREVRALPLQDLEETNPVLRGSRPVTAGETSHLKPENKEADHGKLRLLFF
jgi:hypothetical protein